MNVYIQNGSLAVDGGRDVIPVINELLSLPFVTKIATKDHHPYDHVSFASNHEGKEPFTSTITIANPLNPEETYVTRLWPKHCIIDTPGNELVKELDISKVDNIVLKGMDPRVEMYSAITSPFRSPKVQEATSDLEKLLREREVSHVYVVGLAGDYCVRSTAIDCVQEGGWTTFVVAEAVRSVDPNIGWTEAQKEMEEVGVKIIGLQDEAIKRVGDIVNA
jgi:nicotinamidase-related amidase